MSRSASVYPARVSKKVRQLPLEGPMAITMVVTQMAREGRPPITLHIGEPYNDVPESLKAAAKRVIDTQKIGYSPCNGLFETRTAVANEIRMTRGIEVNPDDVVISAGAKPFIGYAAAIAAGGEVIVPSPGFPTYNIMANFYGCKVVPLPLYEKNGFQTNIGDLEKLITPRTRLFFECDPSNPTGAMDGQEKKEAIYRLAKKHGFYVLADEVYRDIRYNGREHFSIASVPGAYESGLIILTDSMSKKYNATGWRGGWGANPKLAGRMSLMNMNTITCPELDRQAMLIAAYTQTEHVREIWDILGSYGPRMKETVRLANEIPGFSCSEPAGAFYIYPNVTDAVRRLQLPDAEALKWFLIFNGVTVLSDKDFGGKLSDGLDHLRISFSNRLETVVAGMKKIREIIESATPEAVRKVFSENVIPEI